MPMADSARRTPGRHKHTDPPCGCVRRSRPRAWRRGNSTSVLCGADSGCGHGRVDASRGDRPRAAVEPGNVRAAWCRHVLRRQRSAHGLPGEAWQKLRADASAVGGVLPRARGTSGLCRRCLRSCVPAPPFWRACVQPTAGCSRPIRSGRAVGTACDRPCECPRCNLCQRCRASRAFDGVTACDGNEAYRVWGG